jgi:flagella basal body P-ring formation protein FlgA
VKQVVMSALLSLDIECNTALSLKSPNEGTLWEQEICQTYFPEYLNVRLRAIRNTVKQVSSDIGNKKIEITPPIAGRMTIKRVVRENTDAWKLATTSYAIDAFKEVWVARRTIRKNEVLSGQDIEKVLRNVGNLVGLKTFPEQNPTGSFVEKGLPKGQIIYQDYLLSKPLVEKNEEVKVVFKSGSLTLEMDGVALENGFKIDDLIKVRLIDTGKVLTGKVKDNETIAVDN